MVMSENSSALYNLKMLVEQCKLAEEDAHSTLRCRGD